MKKITCACVLLMAFGFTLFAATQEELLREGIDYHNQAQTDPGDNIEKGKKILSSLQDKMPLAKAYYGSIITLEAGIYAKSNGMKALVLLSQGTKIIDAAVKADPDSADIHFLRMINSYGVSQGSPVNRYKAMKLSIDWIGERVTQFDKGSQASFHLYNGLYNIKFGKLDLAMAAFDACIAASPDSSEAKEAEKQKARYAQ